jgi:hypothetical protein
MPLSAWPQAAAMLILQGIGRAGDSTIAGNGESSLPLGQLFPWLLIAAAGLFGSEILIRWLSAAGIRLRLYAASKFNAWMLLGVCLTTWLFWLMLQSAMAEISHVLLHFEFPKEGVLGKHFSGFWKEAAWTIPALLVAEFLRQMIFKEKLEDWRQLCIKRQTMPNYPEGKE